MNTNAKTVEAASIEELREYRNLFAMIDTSGLSKPLKLKGKR